ncbi:uncharacterized protein PHALS_07765 [Plasmopara halstedii]|uniref:Uncharacterized protein n=1 Tax=Plasmopara halstedii TaxID=4781 RepID=A0A0N7L8J3_PLAHL|nr:uncharacterized protein PHALS_07765 [Plasmopara halstedii]CEG50035.1 hypothetical protein PHALS_07765 [Plasmopara halstedii]|eukprot:XP_024586404.1 hypothetical protein PHALS_07765 [Plasmopara halstedii]
MATVLAESHGLTMKEIKATNDNGDRNGRKPRSHNKIVNSDHIRKTRVYIMVSVKSDRPIHLQECAPNEIIYLQQQVGVFFVPEPVSTL